MKKEYQTVIGDKKLNFNIGEMAKQADGSVFVNFGNSDFLVTVTTKQLEEEKDFFPLIINYEEKAYSVGKIPGNYLRREGRPTDKATLNARLIDRPLRPLFPDSSDVEVQIVVTVLGYDKDYEVEMLAISAASVGCMMAGLPLEKLVAGLCVSENDGEFIINPSLEQRESANCIVRVAGHKEALNMIELEGNEISEEKALEMLMFAHNKIKELIAFQEEITLDLGCEKIIRKVENKLKEETLNTIKQKYEANILDVLTSNTNRHNRGEALEELKKKIAKDIGEEEINSEFDEIYKNLFIQLIVEKKYRLDGRHTDEIRDLSSRVDVLKLAHGSALFTRGETQALATCTLGVKNDEQIFDSLEDYETKNFFLHYNFPPYSVGETGRIGSPGRREIGHGMLAEKSIVPMLPKFEEFPYTIRVVSEILESNGSSSQATVCAATMALMHAGVPLKKPVAGIAMGLIKRDENFTILTDIAGLEDHLGDMDFKVAGTKDGITAIQMDMKISGITEEIIRECLEKAKVGRLKILDHMLNTIPEVNENMKDNVLKIKHIKIDKEQIKDVIGRGGETINKIIEKTEVKIDIDDEGNVNVYGLDKNKIEEAINIIKSITKKYEVGQKFKAKITRIEKYGAFVNLDGSQDALLHISNISEKRIEKVEDVLSIGDEIDVEIISIESKNKIKVKKNEK